MANDDNKKDRAGKDSNAASETERKSRRTDDDDTAGEEDQLTPVRPKVGETPDNLRQREDWLRKRSGG